MKKSIFDNIDRPTFLQKTGWQSASTLSSLFFNFLQSILVANILGVSEFGILASFIGASVVLSQLVDPRLLDILIKYFTKLQVNGYFPEQKKLFIFSWVLCTAVTITAIFLCLVFESFLLSKFINISFEHRFLLSMCLFSALSSTLYFNTFQALLRVKENVKLLAMVSIGLYASRFFTIMSAGLLIDLGALEIAFSLMSINAFFSFSSSIR